MNKRNIKYSLNCVVSAAEMAKCKDLHHKKSHQHEHDEACPAEYELNKHIHDLTTFINDNFLNA